MVDPKRLAILLADIRDVQVEIAVCGEVQVLIENKKCKAIARLTRLNDELAEGSQPA